jgi:hypothetical protein
MSQAGIGDQADGDGQQRRQEQGDRTHAGQPVEAKRQRDVDGDGQ